MKIIACEQGSPQWFSARAGLPTASCFDSILTPKTLKPSESMGKYIGRLCAEWFLGKPLDSESSGFMERGTGMEAEAVAAYEFQHNVDTLKVGLCVTDDGLAGGSPDRLVGEDGGLEIKCPSAEVQVGYILNGIDAAYRCQLQGLLWVTGRKWWSFLAYHPVLPHVNLRIEPDPEWVEAWGVAFAKFQERFKEAKLKLAPAKAAYDESLRAAIENADQPF